MCLIVKNLNKSYSIAKKNIPCYKMLRQAPSGSLLTPYQLVRVDLDSPLICRVFQERYSIGGIVNEGIHSFNINANIKQEVKNIQEYTTDRIVYVKAYIPKGTKYWLGNDHDFCSERIIFKDSKLCV